MAVKQQIVANGKLKTDVSGISSDPTNLSVADNALLTREGLIEARHGHQRIPFTTGSGDGASGWNTGLSSEDFITFTQADSAQLDSTYYVHSVLNNSIGARKLAVYSKAGDELVLDASFSYVNGTPFQTGTQTFSKNGTTYSVQPKSQVFTANNKVFVMTDNGLYGGDVRDATVSLRKEINAGWMEYATTAKFETGGDLSKNWMNSSKMITCKFVIEEETGFPTDTSRRIRWSVSRPMDVMLTEFNVDWSGTAAGQPNAANSPFPNIMPTVGIGFGSSFGQSSVPNNSKFFLKVYRTLQYKIGDPVPSDFFLAGPEKLLNTSDGTSSTQVPVSPTAADLAQRCVLVPLEYNDDFIQITEPLYTTGKGSAGREVTTPMPAAHVTQFKGFTIYGDLFEPPTESFSLVRLPQEGDRLVVRAFNALNTEIGITGVQFTLSQDDPSKSNVVIPVNTTKTGNTPSLRGTGGLLRRDYKTIQYYLTSINKSTANHTLTVPLAEDLTTYNSKVGTRPFYSTVAPLERTRATGAVNLRVTPPNAINTTPTNGTKTSSVIDISRFGTGAGMAAIVDFNGNIVTIFTYKTIQAITTTGKVEFSEAETVLGDAFSNLFTGTDLTSIPSKTYYFYPLQGVSASNLPLYVSGGPSTNGYLAVTPIPGRNMLGDIQIATPTRWISGGVGSMSMTAEVLYQAQVTDSAGNRRGLIYTIPSQLTKTAERACDLLNTNSGNKFIKAEPGTGIGEFIIRAIDPQVVRFTVEYQSSGLAPKPDFVYPEAGVVGGNETRGIRRSNGLQISNIDFPEQISREIPGTSQPILSIASDETIMGFGKSTDNVYVFTDKKVHALMISQNSDGRPRFEQLPLVDATVGCATAGSIQSVAGAVVFLATTGFHAVEGTTVRPIGADIDLDVRTAVTKAIKATGPLNISSTRSFVNDPRKLYGCYIPGGYTFVLATDTGRWSRWNLPFDSAVVSTSGQLITTSTLYINNPPWGPTPRWQYMSSDVFTDNEPQNPVDQVELDESLSGASITAAPGTITVDRNLTLAPFGNMKDIQTFTAQRGLNRAFYTSNGVQYGGVVTSTTPTSLTITFDNPSVTIVPNASSDRIRVGVPLVLAFQPHTADAPAELKAYMEWNTHFTTPITGQKWEFRVDSTSTWVAGQTFATIRANQTMYRDFVPVQVGSGRWLERKLTHDTPRENATMTAQTIVYRGISNSNSDIGGK